MMKRDLWEGFSTNVRCQSGAWRMSVSWGRPVKEPLSDGSSVDLTLSETVSIVIELAFETHRSDLIMLPQAGGAE